MIVNVPEEPPRSADVAHAAVVPAADVQPFGWCWRGWRPYRHPTDLYPTRSHAKAAAIDAGVGDYDLLPLYAAPFPAADVREAQNDGGPIRRAAMGPGDIMDDNDVSPMQDDVSEAEVLNAFNMVFDLHKTNIVEWGDMRAVLTAFLASRTKGSRG